MYPCTTTGPFGGLAAFSGKWQRRSTIYLHRLCIKPVGVVYPCQTFFIRQELLTYPCTTTGPAATLPSSSCIEPVGLVYPITLFCCVRSSLRIHSQQGPFGGLAALSGKWQRRSTIYPHRLCIEPVGVVYPITHLSSVRSSLRNHAPQLVG